MNVKLSDGKSINLLSLSYVELRMVVSDIQYQIDAIKNEFEVWKNKKQQELQKELQREISVKTTETKKNLEEKEQIKRDVAALCSKHKQEIKDKNIERANSQDRLFRVAARKTLSEDDFYRVCLAAEGMERESRIGEQDAGEIDA